MPFLDPSCTYIKATFSTQSKKGILPKKRYVFSAWWCLQKQLHDFPFPFFTMAIYLKMVDSCRAQSIKQFSFSCNVMTFLCLMGALPASLWHFIWVHGFIQGLLSTLSGILNTWMRRDYCLFIFVCPT